MQPYMEKLASSLIYQPLLRAQPARELLPCVYGDGRKANGADSAAGRAAAPSACAQPGRGRLSRA